MHNSYIAIITKATHIPDTAVPSVSEALVQHFEPLPALNKK